jgi:rhodanese-related sulfurtransferase
MSKIKVLLVGIWMGAILIAGCQGNADPSVPIPGPTATSTSTKTSNYWELIKQAQSAYAKSDYEAAIDLARQAAGLNPGDETAWGLYTQAVIAQAGETYLSELPDTRYQLPIAVFVRDRVNRTRDWLVIDVREPDEYADGHIEGAINIPLRELLKNLDELPDSKTAPILLYCHTQKRATHALVLLHELGYMKVYNLEGGYAAYEDWMSNNPLPTPGPTPTPGPDEPDFGC